jgi:hypothetical protein
MVNGKLAFGGLVMLTAGCSALSGILPPQLTPPSSQAVQAAAVDAATMNVTITVNISGSDRSVQFNGGNAPTAGLNDIGNLIIGLFDNGSISNSIASLGYVYTGAVGAASPAAAAITISPNSPAYMGDLSGTRLGTAGTGAAASGETVSSTNTTARRYLVRDYGTATTFTSASTTVNFTNVPSDAGTGVHKYVIFAAAYDTAANNLGYTEAALPAAKTQGSSNTTANALTLNLKQGVFTANVAEAPVLTPFVPSATLRGYLPY